MNFKCDINKVIDYKTRLKLKHFTNFTTFTIFGAKIEMTRSEVTKIILGCKYRIQNNEEKKLKFNNRED